MKNKPVLMRVCIDPGHGGKRLGATAGAHYEKNLNWRFAHRLGANLNLLGVETMFTRDTDKELSPRLDSDLKKRAELANEWNADLFLSVHCNANEKETVRKFEAYTSVGETKSDSYAEEILKRIEEYTPIRKGLYEDGDLDLERDFRVLVKTSMPAVLLEFGYMSNDADLAILLSPVFMENTTRIIAQAVVDVFKTKVQIRKS